MKSAVVRSNALSSPGIGRAAFSGYRPTPNDQRPTTNAQATSTATPRQQHTTTTTTTPDTRVQLSPRRHNVPIHEGAGHAAHAHDVDAPHSAAVHAADIEEDGTGAGASTPPSPGPCPPFPKLTATQKEDQSGMYRANCQLCPPGRATGVLTCAQLTPSLNACASSRRSPPN